MQDISQLIEQLMPKVIVFRRDLHRYPELGWSEYRTTSKIIEVFQVLKAELGQEAHYDIVMGADAIDGASRLTPPSPEVCAIEKGRAVAQGAEPQLVDAMEDGLTGLWVDMHFGAMRGVERPVLALRFDIDANDVQESLCAPHFPAKEGFASQNCTIMHACGHDGHAAMGVGVACALHKIRETLDKLPYVIRLIFQPAEEIAQGAKAMLKAGVMRDVSLLYGFHLGIQARTPQTLICGTTHFLDNTSFEVSFDGKAAHSGLAPHEGHNALLAAACAVQGLHAISRHGEGQSRVNVGELHCFGAPNVVPAKATLVGETRGIDSQVNGWMTEEAMRICRAAADMWKCTHSFTPIGHCVDGFSDTELIEDVYALASTMPCFSHIVRSEKFWASEDFTWLLQDVQKRGGQGTFIQLGMEWAQKNRGHHTESFSFDEAALERGVRLLTGLILGKLE